MELKIEHKVEKIIFLIFFVSILFLKTEVNANSSKIGIYGKDYFGDEYANGYIMNRNSSNVIGTSNGVSYKSGLYKGNNTKKSEYVDYSQAAKYVSSNGESILLDMRIYVWTNNSNIPWTLHGVNLQVVNTNKSGI